jgi:hypothetical protein
LYNLITKDKVDIGFSLRALGAVDMLQDGTIMVKSPIRPITYDIVSNPSHENARVLEFLPESATDFIPEHGVICEGEFDNIINNDQIVIQDGDSMVIRFINDIINERFEEIMTKGVKFRI